jgi:hopene-associated glycosyltransferase HpnB
MIALAIAFASLLVWLYLIAFRGGFWRLTEREQDFAPVGAPAPTHASVVAVVPARDEAEVIEASLGSLLGQRFSGRFGVILVDDQSGDGTADVARALAARLGAAERLSVLRTQGPSKGWTGKLNAMQQGFAHARTLPEAPDFVLFCDADIALEPDVLERLVKGALARKTTLASLMVKLRCESAAERWFVPAFVFFFQMLYPFAFVNDPGNPLAAAAGGVMLVRPDALVSAGGLAAIRGALIDDCALGALMKTQGPIWLGLASAAHSLRPYPRFKDIEAMVTRSAYAELRYSPLRLLGALAGMSVVYLAPPAIALFGDFPASAAALLAFALMAFSYAPSLRFYGVSRAYAFALPLIAACYTWFTMESARRHWQGEGGAWKGRYQARAPNRDV